MQYREYLQIVFSSVKQQKLRSILSMLGVIFGVISIVTMFSVGEGAKRKILRQIEQLGVDNIILKTVSLTESQKVHAREHLSTGISTEDVQRIKLAVTDVDIVSPLKEIKASIVGFSKELYPEVIAVSPEFRSVEKISLAAGRFICDLDITEKNFVCVIGSEISRELNFSGLVGANIRIENEMFKIIGILDTRTFNSKDNPVVSVRDLNRIIMIPLSTASYLDPGTLDDYYSEVKVRVRDKDRIFQSAAQIKSIMETTHRSAGDYQVVIPLELLNKQKQTQDNFTFFLGAIAFISLLVGGIGIMNIMLASVSERTQEIGIRRAVGANREHIKMQFLLEAIAISLLGGLFGLILGIVIILLISILGKWDTVINFWIIFYSICMALIVGTLSGLYPALNASNMDPIQALRNE